MALQSEYLRKSGIIYEQYNMRVDKQIAIERGRTISGKKEQQSNDDTAEI